MSLSSVRLVFNNWLDAEWRLWHWPRWFRALLSAIIAIVTMISKWIFWFIVIIGAFGAVVAIPTLIARHLWTDLKWDGGLSIGIGFVLCVAEIYIVNKCYEIYRDTPDKPERKRKNDD